MLTPINKHIKKVFKYLKSATTQDDIHSLHCINNKKEYLESTDRYRIHAVNSEYLDIRVGIGTFELEKMDDKEAELTVHAGNYPDITKAVKNVTTEPITSFAINPNYLRDALAGLSSPALITVQEHYVLVEGYIDTTPVCALIMRIRDNELDIKPSWNPYQ